MNKKRRKSNQELDFGVSCHIMAQAIRAEGTGLEPAETSHLSALQSVTCEEGCTPCAALALHFRRSNCPFLAPVDPELLNVLEAWDSLPENLKKTIVQLVSLAGTPKPNAQ